MQITDYLADVKPLSIHARFVIGLRIFERYVSLRGLQDDAIWTYLAEMWEFPLIHTIEDKLSWEKSRCDLADYGLGDELPEELEEELVSLAINEDYFELWVTNLTELAWGNILDRSSEDASITHLSLLLSLAAKSEVEVPVLHVFKHSKYIHNAGWGAPLTISDLELWQGAHSTIKLISDDKIECAEAIAFFD